MFEKMILKVQLTKSEVMYTGGNNVMADIYIPISENEFMKSNSIEIIEPIDNNDYYEIIARVKIVKKIAEVNQ